MIKGDKIYKLSCGSNILEIGSRTLVMGIVNVTPDSFSDGGDFFNTEQAISHGLSLADEGADILDIGGESTRPFSDEITEDEEITRIAPVIEALAKKKSIPISVDTTKSKVAKAAINSGASIINDISALRFDPHMADVAARLKAPVILMHMKGTPKNMQTNPVYDDLLGEICKFLSDAAACAQEKGIDRSNLIIDPGIGFGKTFEHNLIILKNLDRFLSLNVPVLVGPSRKAFIRNLVKEKGAKDINPKHPDVETGTQAAIAVAVLNGAHIIRTHNVKNTKAALKIIDAVKKA